MDTLDYTKYYDLENYLFHDISSRYQQEKMLGAHDFFCIIIWKANRSKSKIAKRLLAHGPYTDLETAVRTLTQAISDASDNKGRLAVLIDRWEFRLPMASAILSVLFPEDFTVYDVRVCDILGDFHDAQNRTFEPLWERYALYVEQVRNAVPQKASLRDKDRYLWGKSFAQQLGRDLATQFKKPTVESEVDEL